MDRAALLQIAADWSYWDELPPPSLRRSVRLPQQLTPGRALVVQGVRRCGKSTLLTQLLDRYALDPRRCLFVNFEDPRLLGHLTHETLRALVAGFEAERGAGGTYFFDEVQAVDGWHAWLRTQLDRPRGRRFVVTGSNARLLSGELASTLTGRYLAVELFPFDFDEFQTLRPGATLHDYLHAGGFPAPNQSPDRDRMLRGYFNDIVERDVRERVAARSSLPLRQLVQMAFESAGAELSTRRLAAALGIAVDTASLYLEAAESAYLLFGCPWFAFSERKRAVRNRKFYPVDPGLRRAVVTRTGADRGKELECATYLLLRQRYRDLAYWRGAGEVDFVVRDGADIVPVQVGWDGPEPRHQRALDDFYEQFPTAREAVIVDAASFVRGVPELPGEE